MRGCTTVLLFDEDDIRSLIDLSNNRKYEASGTYSDGVNGVYNNERSSMQSSMDKTEVDFEIYHKLHSYSEKYHDKPFVINEWTFVKYKEGDLFTRHTDCSRNIRQQSYITMLEKSDDLEGGKLILYINNKPFRELDLRVGETIMFDSTVEHEVTMVTKGTRKTLVCWSHNC